MKNTKQLLTQQDIKSICLQLKNRYRHPCGYFDNAGRFYAKDNDLMNVRSGPYYREFENKKKLKKKK